MPHRFSPPFDQQEITVANGQDLSTPFSFTPNGGLAFLFPAAWTGATPTMQFQGSIDGVNFAYIDTDNTPTRIVIDVVTGAWVVVIGTDLDALRPFPWLRIQASSNQAAERTVTVAKGV